jgi:hypothetical protein
VLDESVEIAADLSGINNLYLTRLKADAKTQTPRESGSVRNP